MILQDRLLDLPLPQREGTNNISNVLRQLQLTSDITQQDNAGVIDQR